MTAMEPFCHLIGIKNYLLTPEEKTLLEAELFKRICDELKEIFREQYKQYLCLMKFTIEMENMMIEANFAQLLINDILATKEYDLQGIACYTNTYEDVIAEIITGRNTNPSAVLLCRLIDLHRTVRRDMYQVITQKICTHYIQQTETSSMF